MIEILGYIKSRKWVILLVMLLVLVVPYKVSKYDMTDIMSCESGQLNNGTSVKALVYVVDFAFNCDELRAITIFISPLSPPKYLWAIYYWSARLGNGFMVLSGGDFGDGFYQKTIIDWRFPK